MLCACAGAGLLALCMLLSNNGGGSGDMDSLAMLVVLSSIALMYGSPFVGLAIAAGVLDFLKEKNRRAERRRKQGRLRPLAAKRS